MFSKNSYIPPYVKPDLKWFERDGLMTYMDRLSYERFEEDRDNYLSNVNVVNLTLSTTVRYPSRKRYFNL